MRNYGICLDCILSYICDSEVRKVIDSQGSRTYIEIFSSTPLPVLLGLLPRQDTMNVLEECSRR
jgi:hypothetical protein